MCINFSFVLKNGVTFNKKKKIQLEKKIIFVSKISHKLNVLNKNLNYVWNRSRYFMKIGVLCEF